MWLLFSAWLLASCQGPSRALATPATPFLPPTAPPSPTPTVAFLPTVEVITPQPTACTNDLRFVADETIPDGTQVPPEATLIKAWRVRNAGTCPWGPGYTLRFIAGEPLSAEPEQPLFPAAPGAEVRVEVRFRAPRDEGLYQSTWQAFDPEGVAFGDPIFIVIEVVGPTATPTASPTP